jgi:hypothetical protein
MRRSNGLLLAAIELGILSWWFYGADSERGVDALQYHRMANAIVQNGLAPWVVKPLSYIGMYPGSDNSGVPFLAAACSLVSGLQISTTVLVYDCSMLLIFGLGLFVLTHQLTRRTDLAMLAVLMGSFSYGFITALAWSLDGRVFNVALAPVFLFMFFPRGARMTWPMRLPELVVLGLVSAVMLVSHLSFLLLVPFLVVVPLLYTVVYHQHATRRRRRTSPIYFGLIGFTPLALIIGLDRLGVLTSYGLEYGLANSALFSGNSPLIFLANAFVFVGTQVGLVNIVGALIGFIYLATRPHLLSRNITIGGLLWAGFLGLPIVLYSKDLLTPVFVVLGAIGLGGVFRFSRRRPLVTLMVSALLVIAGSFAFDAWNFARSSTAAEQRYLAPVEVTSAARSGNLWISTDHSQRGCVYGNNPILLQEVTSEPGEPYCTGLPVDVLINGGVSSVRGRSPFRVQYVGFWGLNPGNWFTSPDLTQVSNDFANLPSLSFQAGQALLSKYNISFIVVDMRMRYEIPQYNYQGTQPSLFFADLWNNMYPLYATNDFVVFRVG